MKPIYDLTIKGRQFIWGEKQQRPLMRSDIDYKDLQSNIYLRDMDGSNYIQIPASLPLIAHCTKFRMDSQGSLPMQVRECQRQLRIILLQKMDNSNPHEIIPISFTLKSLVGNHFYQINNKD